MNVDLYQYQIAVNLFGAAYGPQNKDRAMSFYYGARGEKTVFRVSNKLRLKPVSSVTETN